MTPADIQRARELLAAADYEPESTNPVDMPFAPHHESAAAWYVVTDVTGNVEIACAREEVADFIAAAPTLLASFVEEIERLRAERDDRAAMMETLIADRDRLTRERDQAVEVCGAAKAQFATYLRERNSLVAAIDALPTIRIRAAKAERDFESELDAKHAKLVEVADKLRDTLAERDRLAGELAASRMTGGEGRPVEIYACETSRIVLRVDTHYVVRLHPTCEACATEAAGIGAVTFCGGEFAASKPAPSSAGEGSEG